MILVNLIIILMLAGVVSWIVAKWSKSASRWIAFGAVAVDFIMAVSFWVKNPVGLSDMGQNGSWLVNFQKEWIPQLGVSFHFSMDGLSLVMAVLTLFVGALSILASWKEIKTKIGFYHFNILWLLGGILGVFFSMDLLLFYFFWEVMLIPMFFLMGIWGFNKRKYASIKFFLFTQISGLLMLLAILGLYFVHGHQTGEYTFDYFALLGTSFAGQMGFWLMCGFLIAFVTKLPGFPFHSWLPDAYDQSPTAGTVILAGLMTKTAAYGLLRFVLPLFPEAAHAIAPWVMGVGVIGILYGAKMAYAQTNLKRLIAFSSFSHMGFILLGIFSFEILAYQGTVMEMLAHGISISALFIIAGALQERTGITDIRQMGGLWQQMPRMGAITMIFVLATVGLPGLGNFIAEFLILSGTFQASTLWAILGALGLIGSMIYALNILQRVFHNQNAPAVKENNWNLSDFSAREHLVMACLIIVIVWLGLFPQKVFDTVKPVFEQLETQTQAQLKPTQQSSVVQYTAVLRKKENYLTALEQGHNALAPDAIHQSKRGKQW